MNQSASVDCMKSENVVKEVEKKGVERQKLAVVYLMSGVRVPSSTATEKRGREAQQDTHPNRAERKVPLALAPKPGVSSGAARPAGGEGGPSPNTCQRSSGRCRVRRPRGGRPPLVQLELP